MRTPLIGANLWIWDSPVTTAVIRDRVPRVAAMGFDAVELPLEAPGDWTVAEVRPVLEETGLQAGVCAAMAPGRDLTTDDSSVVRSTQDYLRACIEAAAGIGATVVAGPIYSPTGQTGAISPDQRARTLEMLARNLAPVVAIADDQGIRIAVEPLNRFETSLFNTVEQTMALLDAVDHPALGLLLDTFHLNIEERDIGGAIRRAGDRLVHFHACGNDRGAPGDDTIDWIAVRDALNDVGYGGAVTIESFTSANRTIATAASIWRPLAPTQDALASDGLAFLRQLFGSATPGRQLPSQEV
jgi:D-psicose/D-tagatose/L-ribulose 3-epimerase